MKILRSVSVSTQLNLVTKDMRNHSQGEATWRSKSGLFRFPLEYDLPITSSQHTTIEREFLCTVFGNCCRRPDIQVELNLKCQNKRKGRKKKPFAVKLHTHPMWQVFLVFPKITLVALKDFASLARTLRTDEPRQILSLRSI